MGAGAEKWRRGGMTAKVLDGIKIGDVAIFKCGGAAKITDVQISNMSPVADFFLRFDGSNLYGVHYTEQGHLLAVSTGQVEFSPFSIVKIKEERYT